MVCFTFTLLRSKIPYFATTSHHASVPRPCSAQISSGMHNFTFTLLRFRMLCFTQTEQDRTLCYHALTVYYLTSLRYTTTTRRPALPYRYIISRRYVWLRYANTLPATAELYRYNMLRCFTIATHCFGLLRST